MARFLGVCVCVFLDHQSRMRLICGSGAVVVGTKPGLAAVDSATVALLSESTDVALLSESTDIERPFSRVYIN